MAGPGVSNWRSTRRRPLSSFSSRVVFGVVLPLALRFDCGVHAFAYRNTAKPFRNNVCRTKKRLPFTRGIASTQDQNTPNNFDIPNDSGAGDASGLYSLRNPSFSQERQVEWDEVLGTDLPPLGAPGSLWKQYSIAAVSTCLATAMCWLLIAASGVGAWRYYLAGGLCAAISHTVPVPIDVVKTRKQIDPTLSNMNFIEATSYMLKNEGMRSLWAGLGPTLFGYLIEGAIKFGVYEATKPYVRRMLVFFSGLAPSMAFLNSHILSLVFCGAASGVAASIFLCPMEALRIRMVAQHNAGVNWVRAGSNILATEGAGFLFRGITPMLYKQVPYTITKNGSFDVVTRAAYGFLRTTGTAVSPRLKVGIPVIAGAVASILSCIASQPGDMLLSLQNANAGERRRTRDIVRDILSSNRGINGFMVGIKTRFLHVGVTVTLQLFLYDSIKQLCGIAATGSV
ncbi:hypothetical protein FisN_5Lh399 [Fistulifera solaris]|uniref:Solute carrier family 25 (Mitochondrial phosphate transporter), member 23/24/25/41 n=1 Tax=Fistulifera solaris TaxID=1519565 RepID=A0A1Z5KG70_FISSO|nr:hypothetical protein FisN_5Lh399 [Fistulifera solaris]|eukprot:GAX25310.1 hypothetical protein FisN_5Lh399 [Fistulifera solaris]